MWRISEAVNPKWVSSRYMSLAFALSIWSTGWLAAIIWSTCSPLYSKPRTSRLPRAAFSATFWKKSRGVARKSSTVLSCLTSCYLGQVQLVLQQVYLRGDPLERHVVEEDSPRHEVEHLAVVFHASDLFQVAEQLQRVGIFIVLGAD